MLRPTALLLFASLLLVPVAAQEQGQAPRQPQLRHATIKLDDGRLFEGRVVSMDLEYVVLEVDGKHLRIRASAIRNCRFRGDDEVKPAQPAPAGGAAANPAATPAQQDGSAQAGPTQAPADGAPAQTPQQPQQLQPGTAAGGAPAAPAGETAPTANGAAAPARAEGGAEAPAANGGAATQPAEGGATAAPAGKDAAPVPAGKTTQAQPAPSAQASQQDLPRGPLLKRRIAALDRIYPWLSPAAPSQWISLGLLLLVGSGLMVHMSVCAAGGERVQLGRSVGLGIWYLLTGFGQVAMVPVHDLSVTLMLLGNTTMSLFLLCGLFGLTRWQAMLAMLVQLGFGALVYGTLELVTSLLGSVGVTA